jgi:hypothetical protein
VFVLICLDKYISTSSPPSCLEPFTLDITIANHLSAMTSSRDLRLAAIAEQDSIKFTDAEAGRRRPIVRVDRSNEKGSFWLQFAEPKDFSRIHPITGDNVDDLYIISHSTTNFYFNRADFEASDMIPVIEEVSGMSEVQRLIVDFGITTLELIVYYNFKCFGVHELNSVWAARELQENEDPHKPSLKFLCSIASIRQLFQGQQLRETCDGDESYAMGTQDSWDGRYRGYDGVYATVG